MHALRWGAGICLALIVASAEAAKLEIEIHDLSNDKGNVAVYVYEGATYDKEKFPEAFDQSGTFRGVQTKTVKANQQKAAVTFDGLTPGQYAVSVHHDENCNATVDKNLVGIPTEGGGFSNNPSISLFNRPAFAKSVLDLKDGTMTINIKGQYPPGYRQQASDCSKQ